MIFIAFFFATSSSGLVAAQPSNGPLMPNVLAAPGQSTLRGLAQWTLVPPVDGEQLANAKVGKEFLFQVEAALGQELPDGQSERYMSIVEGLRATFESLEKNAYGNLGHAAVRYALHRFFVARQGWRIKGLDPVGQHFNSASPVQVFAGKIPVHAQVLFEKRLSGKGFGLHELAVFAALLENLISQESAERVVRLFSIMSLPLDGAIQPEVVNSTFDTYLTAYILGIDLNSDTTTRAGLLDSVEQMPSIYTSWEETKRFVRQIQAEVIEPNKAVTIADVQTVVRKMGVAFGHKTNKECQDQKSRLMKLEVGEKGCVPFSTFYKPMIESAGHEWHFGESPEYLSQLGAVDSSDPANLQVMIPNYLYAPSNCIAASSYYQVCCIDECEALLGHIEQHVQGPAGTTSLIVRVVSRLPSSTEPAKRNLTSAQIQRLHMIAERNGGQVPIHGRLFMQWMHNLYPRECPYPHLSGTTEPLPADVYTSKTGKDSTATMEEMRAMTNVSMQSAPSGEQCGQWRDDEEFLASMSTRMPGWGEFESDERSATGADQDQMKILLMQLIIMPVIVLMVVMLVVGPRLLSPGKLVAYVDGFLSGKWLLLEFGGVTAILPPGEALAGDECVICLGGCEDGCGRTHRWRRLKCGHHFHEACILQWLRKARQCPVCRRYLDEMTRSG